MSDHDELLIQISESMIQHIVLLHEFEALYLQSLMIINLYVLELNYLF
jgi:hypothetical protein